MSTHQSCDYNLSPSGNNSERCGWERMVWGCQDILRMHLSHLLVLATSPRTHFTTRTRAVHTLTSHPRSQAIVSYVVKSNHQVREDAINTSNILGSLVLVFFLSQFVFEDHQLYFPYFSYSLS